MGELLAFRCFACCRLIILDNVVSGTKMPASGMVSGMFCSKLIENPDWTFQANMPAEKNISSAIMIKSLFSSFTINLYILFLPELCCPLCNNGFSYVGQTFRQQAGKPCNTLGNIGFKTN